MTKDEMKNKISMALKDLILQQGFECICKENAELKKQIEKMKCCQNCKFDDFMEEPCCNCSRCFGDMREGYSDKWEIN